MSGPSPEQLANLVDRAARKLGPEEGELLRAGFASLEQARRSAGGLQAALNPVRNRLTRAEAALHALVEAADFWESGTSRLRRPSVVAVCRRIAAEGLAPAKRSVREAS